MLFALLLWTKWTEGETMIWYLLGIALLLFAVGALSLVAWKGGDLFDWIKYSAIPFVQNKTVRKTKQALSSNAQQDFWDLPYDEVVRPDLKTFPACVVRDLYLHKQAEKAYDAVVLPLLTGERSPKEMSHPNNIFEYFGISVFHELFALEKFFYREDSVLSRDQRRELTVEKLDREDTYLLLRAFVRVVHSFAEEFYEDALGSDPGSLSRNARQILDDLCYQWYCASERQHFGLRSSPDSGVSEPFFREKDYARYADNSSKGGANLRQLYHKYGLKKKRISYEDSAD